MLAVSSSTVFVLVTVTLCGVPESGSTTRTATSRPGPVVLASPVTHSDWMLHKPAPEWGPAGVRQILDRCRQCGIRRVYWRCFDGGRASYLSRLMDPLHGMDADNYHVGRDSAWVIPALKQFDYGSFDGLKEAIAYGHRIGLEVHVWLTVNEDDHGWGITSRFTRENPDSRWVRRDGRAFRSQQSFAFAQVRDYKLALLREVLAYVPDGVFFDWIRTGDVRDNPQTDSDGVALYGYEEPNLQAFQQMYGEDARRVANSDERWVRVRAEPQTAFMREAAKTIRRLRPGVCISALVQQPWGYRGAPNDTIYRDNLRGLLIDVRTWAAEGIVDEVFPAGYYRAGGSPEAAVRAVRSEIDDKANVSLFGWIASPEQFRTDTALAERLGVRTLLLWESDYLELAPARAELVKAMADYARAAPATASAPAR